MNDATKKEIVDPISGEITEHTPMERPRIRDYFLDDLGREIPDPRPMDPPLNYKRQPSMFELVREQVQREVALYAANREPESFEDAEDFDIPDDPVDPNSPWENDFDPPWSEVKIAIEEARAAKANSPAGQPLATRGPAERGAEPGARPEGVGSPPSQDNVSGQPVVSAGNPRPA